MTHSQLLITGASLVLDGNMLPLFDSKLCSREETLPKLCVSVGKTGLVCSAGEMHKRHLQLFTCYATFETCYLNKSP